MSDEQTFLSIGYVQIDPHNITDITPVMDADGHSYVTVKCSDGTLTVVPLGDETVGFVHAVNAASLWNANWLRLLDVEKAGA